MTIGLAGGLHRPCKGMVPAELTRPNNRHKYPYPSEPMDRHFPLRNCLFRPDLFSWNRAMNPAHSYKFSGTPLETEDFLSIKAPLCARKDGALRHQNTLVF